MLPLFDPLYAFLDTLTGHLALVLYLLAITDEHAVRQRLKKLPVLILSPAAATALSAVLYSLPLPGWQYFISSLAVMLMCTLWVRWAWMFDFWQAFAAVCMASVFQVAGATVSFWVLSEDVLLAVDEEVLFAADEDVLFAAAAVVHLGIAAIAAGVLYRLRFGKWFRVLLARDAAPWRTALLLFTLEASMEIFLWLARGIQAKYLPFYFTLVAVMAVLMAALVVYLARRADDLSKIQAQQDVINQQRLYEQDLEAIRGEVRAFRHDYKNLLAGLSQQDGEAECLRKTLAELDSGFDMRLGRKIQVSAQIGNLRVPEVRSLLLSKIAGMREMGVECALEVLYPVTDVYMDVWDFVRCLGILTDNAAEAAAETERPWVEILFLEQDGRVFLRVSNPYANPIDSEKLWDEGWSTKGTGRGIGLFGYQQILSCYPNASACTSWENGVFVQELTVVSGL